MYAIPPSLSYIRTRRAVEIVCPPPVTYLILWPSVILVTISNKCDFFPGDESIM